MKPKGRTGRSKQFDPEESYKVDKSAFKMRIGFRDLPGCSGVSGGQLKSVRTNGKYETWSEIFY